MISYAMNIIHENQMFTLKREKCLDSKEYFSFGIDGLKLLRNILGISRAQLILNNVPL